jgi:hypothetical protein
MTGITAHIIGYYGELICKITITCKDESWVANIGPNVLSSKQEIHSTAKLLICNIMIQTYPWWQRYFYHHICDGIAVSYLVCGYGHRYGIDLTSFSMLWSYKCRATAGFRRVKQMQKYRDISINSYSFIICSRCFACCTCRSSSWGVLLAISCTWTSSSLRTEGSSLEKMIYHW